MKRMTIAAVGAALAGWVLAAAAVAQQATVEAPIARALEALGPDGREYNDHLVTLANPFFEGRAPGTRGAELAAEYIEFQFKRLGLTPLFHARRRSPDGAEFVLPRGSYRQRVEGLGRMAPQSEHRMAIEAPGEGGGGAVRRELAPGEDFTTLGYSGAGQARGEVVFVGYSIAEGPEGYTSYPAGAAGDGGDEGDEGDGGGGADLSGKVAMMLRFEPLGEQGDSRWAAQGWSAAAGLAPKIGEAMKRGAAGVILVNAPGANDPRAEQLIEYDRRRAEARFNRPVVMMTVEQADALVRAGDAQGRSLAELRAHADAGGAPVALRATVEIATADEVSSDNVGAMIEGRGALAGEWLIIGAHYDHVGRGRAGSLSPDAGQRTHPGADDNASGTAALLLAARLLREEYEKQPQDADLRSIALVAFTAEEMGLLGSEWFVSKPPMPREQMELMFNLDMVGRLRDGALEIEGANSAAGLQEWTAPYFESSGMQVALLPQIQPNSDHASFYFAEVPVLCFFTGFHPEYHRPGDVAALVNRRGAVQITKLVVDLAMGLAVRPESLEFTEARGERMVIGRAQPQQPDAADAPEAPADEAVVVLVEPPEEQAPAEPEEEIPEFPVHLGVVARQTDGGVVFVEVDDESPAQAGGIRAGDVLLRWNRQEIPDRDTWWKLLEAHTPGDLVTVLVRRGGKEVTGYVILAQPK